MAEVNIVKERLLRIADNHDSSADHAKNRLCEIMKEAIDVLREIDEHRGAAARFRSAANTGRID